MRVTLLGRGSFVVSTPLIYPKAALLEHYLMSKFHEDTKYLSIMAELFSSGIVVLSIIELTSSSTKKAFQLLR